VGIIPHALKGGFKMVFVFYKGGKCKSITKREFDEVMHFTKYLVADYFYL